MESLDFSLGWGAYSRLPSYILTWATLDKIEDALQVEQSRPSDLTGLTNASGVDLTLRIKLVEFRSAESRKVLGSRFRGTNPYREGSVSVG